MRAAALAIQLTAFSSTSIDAPGPSQPSWSEEDDMRPSSKRTKRRERRRSRPPTGFSGTQVASALDLLANQTAQDLSSADFSAFKRKYSWQELAQGVIDSLARSLLELEEVPETAERAHLLWHRLEARRDAGVRTTRETQDAIELMRRTSGCVASLSLSALRNGDAVRDLQASIRCASCLLSLWTRVSALATHVSPRTTALHRLMRSALEAVERRLDACEADKVLACTSLASLAPLPDTPSTQVVWSDGEYTCPNKCEERVLAWQASLPLTAPDTLRPSVKTA